MIPKKTFYIIIGISAIILLIIFILPFFLKNKSGQSMTVKEVVQEFWPFGKPPSSTNFQNNTGSTKYDEQIEISSSEKIPIPRLRQLTKTPTSGSVIIKRENTIIENKIKKIENKYYVRYLDRGTGHIDETGIDNLKEDRISNSSLSRVYEATFSQDGNSILGRTLASNLDDIKTFTGNLVYLNFSTSTPVDRTSTSTKNLISISSTTTATSTSVNLKRFLGKYLDLNIREIAFSPSKSKIITLTYNTITDGSNISMSNFDGTSKKTILSSPIREWLLHFPTETKAVLSTKPSGITNGFAYTLDLTTGGLSKIAGNLPGLTVLPSRNLSNVLVGSGGQSLSLSILRLKDKASLGSFKTIPDKCVWAKKNNDVLYCAIPESIPQSIYPDYWYQGFISFNDEIWKIDTKTGISSSIATPELLVKKSIDAINLDISPDDNYLTFINKKDLTLWGLTLENEDSFLSATTSTSTTKK